MQANFLVQAEFIKRELCAGDRAHFQRDDEQVAYTVLFDLEDGEEVISVELSQSSGDMTYLCHIIANNSKYDIRIATNARGATKWQAIARAFKQTKIILSPTLEELNPRPDVYRIDVTSAMNAIAEALGVKRHKIFIAGANCPLR